jgi:hypothetical protein
MHHAYRHLLVASVSLTTLGSLYCCGGLTDSRPRAGSLVDAGEPDDVTSVDAHSGVFCTNDGRVHGPADPPRVVECAAGFDCGKYQQYLWRCCVLQAGFGRIGCDMETTWEKEDAGMASSLECSTLPFPPCPPR